MDLSDTFLKGNEQFYASLLEEHGETAAGVGWKTDENRDVRFAQMHKLIAPDTSYSLNEIGCGYGAFLEYLQGQGHIVRYCGFDLLPAMLEAARKRHRASEECAWVSQIDAMPIADYTVAIGTYNFKGDYSDVAWFDIVLGYLHKMRALSTKGFAFGMRSSYSDPAFRKPGIYHADPLRWFDVCKQEFSSDVALLHDYGHYDFTMLVRLPASQ